MPENGDNDKSNQPLASSTVRSLARQNYFFWLAVLVWTLVLAGFAVQNQLLGRETQKQLAIKEARALVDKDIVYRRWNAGHGGVYVPVTKETRPNPYLTGLADRDVMTDDGRLLTMINPAFMTRQVHELQKEEFGAQGHLTSLKPLNPQNAPDPWEKRALHLFEQGRPEVTEVVETSSGPALRLMKPLEVVPGCLNCHESQGYRLGDVRGGLSVTLPLAPFIAAQSRENWFNFIAHAAVWLVGLAGLIAGYGWVRKSEMERAEDEEAIRGLFRAMEQSPASVMITNTDGAIEWVNPRFTKVTGYTAEEAVGADARLLRSENHPQEFYDDLWRTISSGREWRGEILSRRKNGETYWEESWISPVLTASGRISHYVAVAEDVTERKRSREEIVRAKEAAEEASRAKSEFLANLSHEFRTPMNGIIGMVELTLDTPLTSEQYEYLSMVRTSADALHTLLNDLLDFSKIEAGRMELDAAPFELRRSLGDVVHALAFQAAEKNVELLMDVEADVPEHLVGDSGRLRQVLLNLVGNAVKFTDQGEIVVRAAMEKDGPEGPTLFFSVSDTGVGIPPEQQGRVFEAFTQVDGSVTRKYGGTGLGLAICTRLVEMFGGSMGLESEPGRGSTFYFTAVFGRPVEPEAQVAAAAPEELAGLRVLVVDDNDTGRRILVDSLLSWSMVPLPVADGREALAEADRAFASGEGIDLVLMDSQMPGMDGFTTAAQLREKPAVRDATVIMLTSSADQGDRARCRALGMSAYLSKPVRPSELIEVILASLGERRNGEASGAARRLHTGGAVSFSGRPLKVLVAEDNHINRRLTQRLLEKAGHEVVLASNGREALERIEALDFDLVLMDIQMPEVDGLEAAAAIRRAEEGTGRRLPLAAMTAYAMKGDRERFMAAGFDAYLAKPIRLTELWQCIENLGACAEEKGEGRNAPGEEVPDRRKVLRRLDDDEELLSEIVNIFIDELELRLTAVREAVASGDAAAVEREAHTLKGSVGYFTGGRAYQCAARLVDMARDRRLSGAVEEADLLETETRRLAALIKDWA